MSPPLQRILIIGSSCSGKSTLAGRVSASASLPCVELDDLFWGAAWKPKSTEEFRSLVSAAAAEDRWVIEGNYSDVRDILWPRANAVVWLNYTFPLVFWRAVRRTIARNVTKQELWHGNRESIRRSFLSSESILVWVATTWRKRRRQFEVLRESGSFPHVQWFELKHPAQAHDFLLRVKQDAG